MLSSDDPDKPPVRRTARMGKMYRPKSHTTGTESIHSATESVASSTSSGIHSSTGKYQHYHTPRALLAPHRQ